MKVEDIAKQQKAAAAEAKNHTVHGSYGMAASAVKEATEAGEKVLKQGGTAADAVIAMQFALSVVEPMNTGIAAGGFIVYYDSTIGETKIINGHTRAPQEVTPELFHDDEGNLENFDIRSTSAKSVGVPGIMKAMELASRNYGRLPLEKLIDPAIKLAEEEYRVPSIWERTIDLFQHRMGEEGRKVFMPGGKILKEGDYLTQPGQAKALKKIRDEGFDAVYKGAIADAVVETIQQQGGLMTKDDMESYSASIDSPFWSTYKSFDLAFPAPPNGGGFASAQMLRLLEPMNISQWGVRSWKKYHLISEMLRLVLADQRTHIGDPHFTDIPMQGLFDETYLEERRKLFRMDHLMDTAPPGEAWEYQPGENRMHTRSVTDESGMETTHFTAVDQWGNIAACTSSLERMFGCGIMVPEYGIMLNNDLTDFTPEPGAANEPNAGKYAVSSKAPAIIFKDGQPFFTIGSPGGSTIIGNVVQVLLHVLEYNLDLKDAIAEPRIYTTPDLDTQWEDGLEKEALEKLAELGYELDQGFREVSSDTKVGDVKAVLINPADGTIYGATDSPRPGTAAGITEPPENK